MVPTVRSRSPFCGGAAGSSLLTASQHDGRNTLHAGCCSLDRRKVIHFNVTDAPSALSTPLQLIQAFPFNRFIIRDRDGVPGAVHHP